jgi:hypothetical protein
MDPPEEVVERVLRQGSGLVEGVEILVHWSNELRKQPHAPREGEDSSLTGSHNSPVIVIFLDQSDGGGVQTLHGRQFL